MKALFVVLAMVVLMLFASANQAHASPQYAAASGHQQSAETNAVAPETTLVEAASFYLIEDRATDANGFALGVLLRDFKNYSNRFSVTTRHNTHNTIERCTTYGAWTEAVPRRLC
jgi:hypothetical protein